jgi:hypothetical protein
LVDGLLFISNSSVVATVVDLVCPHRILVVLPDVVFV